MEEKKTIFSIMTSSTLYYKFTRDIANMIYRKNDVDSIWKYVEPYMSDDPIVYNYFIEFINTIKDNVDSKEFKMLYSVSDDEFIRYHYEYNKSNYRDPDGFFNYLQDRLINDNRSNIFYTNIARNLINPNNIRYTNIRNYENYKKDEITNSSAAFMSIFAYMAPSIIQRYIHIHFDNIFEKFTKRNPLNFKWVISFHSYIEISESEHTDIYNTIMHPAPDYYDPFSLNNKPKPTIDANKIQSYFNESRGLHDEESLNAMLTYIYALVEAILIYKHHRYVVKQPSSENSMPVIINRVNFEDMTKFIDEMIYIISNISLFDKDYNSGIRKGLIELYKECYRVMKEYEESIKDTISDEMYDKLYFNNNTYLNKEKKKLIFMDSIVRDYENMYNVHY